MDRLWSREGPTSVREVVDSLKGERDLAYTTVMTVMDNLHRKNMVTRQKRGRAYVYRPAQTKEVFSGELIASVIDESGDRPAALLHFIGQLTPDEVARIRAALSETRGTSRRTFLPIRRRRP